MEHDWKTRQAQAGHHHGRRDQVRTWRCSRCGATVTLSSKLPSPDQAGDCLGDVSPDCDVEVANRVMRS